MTVPLQVLMVEDSASDAKLLAHELRRTGQAVDFERVDTAAALRAALEHQSWDVVLSDSSMPQFSARAALDIIDELRLDLPFIIVSGTIGEEAAVEAMRAGAHDYVLKDRLARLVPAVEREIREHKIREDRRLATKALLASEERYRQIVESTSDGIVKVDANAVILFANKRFADMLGYTLDELIGQSVLSFMDSEARAIANVSLQRRLLGASETTDITFRRKDGSDLAVSSGSTPVFDDDGVCIGSLASLRDVTEQKKLMAQLIISDRMASVGTLAAGVAHEINNPLSVILANLEYVTSRLAAVADDVLQELKEPIDDARDAADRVRLIVRDLKIFARSEEDKQGPVDIERVMDSTLRMAWNEIRHRARITKHYGKTPQVKANESRLGQVFLNLVVNAAQAIPEGRYESNEIRIDTRTDDHGRAVIEITDTGPGIPPEVMRRLFTPFFSTKPPGEGTGLGLSICQRLVTSFGGEICAETRVGGGTTFRVVLLPDVSEPRPDEVPKVASATVGPRARILIVEDEKAIGLSIRRTLGEHEVAVVTSVKDALAQIGAGHRFDVIISDLMMPDMTGMDLHEALLRLAPDQARRMVFFTGGAFTPRARAFLDSVPNARLDKPFDFEELRTLIAERLR